MGVLPSRRLALLCHLSAGRGDTLMSQPPASAHCVPPPAHTDSEAEGRSCASASGHHPAMTRDPASPPPAPETPSPAPLPPDLAHCDLLGSRLERE